MKSSQPPLRAQLLLALLTHPWQLAPSLAAKCVRGTSSSSAARAGVYSSPILARHVESALVDTSARALPACLLAEHLLSTDVPSCRPMRLGGYARHISSRRQGCGRTRLMRSERRACGGACCRTGLRPEMIMSASLRTGQLILLHTHTDNRAIVRGRWSRIGLELAIGILGSARTVVSHLHGGIKLPATRRERGGCCATHFQPHASARVFVMTSRCEQ